MQKHRDPTILIRKTAEDRVDFSKNQMDSIKNDKFYHSSCNNIIADINKYAKTFIIHVGVFSIFFNIILFSSPIYMIQIYNRVLPTRSEEVLIWLTALVVVLFICMSAVDMARHMILVRLSKAFEDRVTEKAMHISLSADQFSAPESGMTILRDIDQIRSLLTKGHLVSLLDILWFPIFVLAVGYFHPILAILALAAGAWLALIAWLSHISVTPALETTRSHAVSALSSADQLFAKVEVVHALGMRTALIDRWMQTRSSATTAHTTASERHAAISSVSRSSRMLAQSLTLGMGAYLALQGAISAGAIIAASVLVGRALAPIETSIGAWQDLQKAWAAYDRLSKFFRHSAGHAVQPLVQTCEGRLTVEDLSCSIGNRIILQDINFRVEPGELIAIVGPSGCGKTTLARHLVGILHPEHGMICLDDLNVTKLSSGIRNRYLGYVPQEVQLLDGTIIDSIGRFEKPIPEEILATAELAGIHKMIMRLPDHYGTRIGADGVRLSSGQRQRLAVARALYGEPKFLVLDEPCAHLDEANEQALIQTLTNLIERGMTICLITHKANLVRLASKVLILNAQGQGRIGTPSDLFRPKLHPIGTDGRRVA